MIRNGKIYKPDKVEYNTFISLPYVSFYPHIVKSDGGTPPIYRGGEGVEWENI